MTDRMTLYRGDREIQLFYVGRGHTAGDVVVYLPKERVLCSGDLLVNQVANLVDGYVNEWPDALEKLRSIDFVDVIPGHGDPFKGKERIDWFQSLSARHLATGGEAARLTEFRRPRPRAVST